MYVFDYPTAFVTRPDYTARRGQHVRVLRQLSEDEADRSEELERMFEFVSEDGFVGHAFESELVPTPNA
jgi:hypothetical protein